MTEDHTYQLLIQLKQSCQIRIGALGNQHFPAGYYIYTGSAKRNMAARLARHCRKDKPRRWHIDYLTCHSDAKVLQTITSKENECVLNQETTGNIAIPRFGASDCSEGCGAHLKYLGTDQAQTESSFRESTSA